MPLKSVKVLCWRLTCALDRTVAPPPPCRGSVCAPSAPAASFLSGRLRGSSACEPAARQTVPRTPCQSGPFCCRCRDRPKRATRRWGQSPVSSERSWWWSSWGKWANLGKGRGLGRAGEGKSGALARSCTWDWGLLTRWTMLRMTGADVGVADSVELTAARAPTWSSPGKSSRSPLVLCVRCSWWCRLKGSTSKPVLTFLAMLKSWFPLKTPQKSILLNGWI